MLGIRILLVDDEEAFTTAMQKRLSARDMTVMTASSGQEALKTLDENPDIDVVVLDVKMPGMDGIQTLREIKKSHPLCEVIMLTAHATVESAIDGMKLGAFDYLMKPCELDELLHKTQEARAKKLAHQEKILEAAGKELRGRRGR